MAAVLAGAGTEVDHVVGRADRLFVVLDDDHAVALIAQPRERGEQAPVVALMEADGRLVEHVEHARQVRADLRRQPDALPFPARQRRGAARQRQIAHAHIVQELDAIANLAEQAAGDQVLAFGELEAFEHAQRFGDRQRDVFLDRASLDAHGPALGPQPLAMTVGTGPQRAIRFERLAFAPRSRVEAPPQVRQQPFEAFTPGIVLAFEALRQRLRRSAVLRAARSRLVATCGLRLARAGAEEQQVAVLLRELAERRVEVDAERFAQAIERVADQPAIAAAPRRDRALPSVFDSSGTTRAGSKSNVAPRP